MNRFVKLKVLILALFAAGVSLFALTRGTTPTWAAVVNEPSSPRTLYVQNCARCHGADGKAETKLGRKYDADDISGGVGTSKTIRVVTNGKGKMPSFKRRLTSAQIAQIANFVSSL